MEGIVILIAKAGICGIRLLVNIAAHLKRIDVPVKYVAVFVNHRIKMPGEEQFIKANPVIRIAVLGLKARKQLPAFVIIQPEQRL